MRKRTDNPVLDSQSYTFVSMQTLQNTFPSEGTPIEQSRGSVKRDQDGFKLTGAKFAKALKRVSRKISEPGAKRSGTLG
jgi:hypothetical protein